MWADEILEAIFEMETLDVIVYPVRSPGWLIIKAFTLGVARAKFGDLSVLAVGIAGWVLIIFVAHRLWPA